MEHYSKSSSHGERIRRATGGRMLTRAFRMISGRWLSDMTVLMPDTFSTLISANRSAICRLSNPRPSFSLSLSFSVPRDESTVIMLVETINIRRHFFGSSCHKIYSVGSISCATLPLNLEGKSRLSKRYLPLARTLQLG